MKPKQFSDKLQQFSDLIDNLPKIDFDKENHKYSENGVNYLSVTTLMSRHLAQPALNFLKKEEPEKLNEFAKKGTAIHKAIETFITTWNLNKIEEEYEDHVNCAMWMLQKIKVSKYLKSEVIISNSSVLLAGTIDLIGLLENGDLFILDWKTSLDSTYDNYIQAEIYRIMLEKELWRLFEEKINVHIFIVNIPREKPSLAHYKQFSYIRNPIAEAIWQLHSYNVNVGGTLKLYWEE